VASKSLGTLTIDLVAKTAGFVQGMDKAERESAKFRKKIEKDMKQVGGAMAKAFAIGATAVAAGTVAIVKKQMELIDQTSKMAKALNTSYQSMENIKRAAELSGVGIEQLDNAMKKLADNIGEAISGSKTQAEVFDRLGISAKELYSIPVDERVDKINRALKDNIPIAERAAVAADLYGAKNALFMQQIDSGTIEEAARQVKVFGLAISDLDAEKIEMSGDAMSVFGTALDGFEKQLTIGLSTALYGISDAFLDASEDAGGFGVQGVKAADGMVEAFLAVGDVVDALGRTINITGSEYASLAIRAQKYAMLLKLPFSGGADQKAMMEEIKMLNRALGEGESARESILMSPQFSAAMRERIKAAQAELDKMAKENADKRSREVATGVAATSKSVLPEINQLLPADDEKDIFLYGMPYAEFTGGVAREGYYHKGRRRKSLPRSLLRRTKSGEKSRLPLKPPHLITTKAFSAPCMNYRRRLERKTARPRGPCSGLPRRLLLLKPCLQYPARHRQWVILP
jgi:hypothetical protein